MSNDLNNDYNLTKNSFYFDIDYYLKQYTDVKNQGVDPVQHYLNIGYKEGRNPSAYFDTIKYRNEYKIPKDQNPLLYFLKEGIKKIHKTFGLCNYIEQSFYFNISYYLAHNNNYNNYKDSMTPQMHYLLIGYNQSDPSQNFNSKKYLLENPDVKGNPLLHYERFGRKEGRAKGLSKNFKFLKAENNLKIKTYDIIIINNLDTKDGVYIWRIQFLKEELDYNNISSTVIDINNKPNNFEYLVGLSKAIIFVRKSLDWLFIKVVQLARSSNIKIICDIDDYLLPTTTGLSQGGIKSKSIQLNNYNDYQHLSLKKMYNLIPLLTANSIICSTGFLKKEFEALNCDVLLRKNVISNSISSLVLNEASKYRSKSNEFKILISSGSDSHNYDLSTIVPELINFSLRHNCAITFLGKFSNDISNCFKACRFINKLDYIEMLKEIAIHDLVIIPLDINHFNNCKSNIKFIEASIVKTPCLAPEVEEYKNLSTQDELIFLYNKQNFYNQLERIYTNRINIEQTKINAYEFTKANLTNHPNSINKSFISEFNKRISSNSN